MMAPRQRRLSHHLSPFTAGLSHMTEYGQKEGIVPAGAFDFAPNGSAVWMGSQDIESEPAESGEVLGSIVLARAIAILGEVDVEHPMELVLDAPMAASEMQQPLG